MNREIKFRAKSISPNEKEWVYGSYMESYYSTRYGLISAIFYNDNEKTKRIPIKQDTVGQFTGLYDKNEKEIYEFDIIKIKNGDEYFKACVVYSDDCAQFILRCDQIKYDFETLRYIEQRDMEVIGNIEDNENLLRGGK